MEQSIKNYILGLELSDLQVYENMAVAPLLTSVDGGPEYITLKESLEKALFVVTEVNEGGSVPELRVANKGGIAVLLLDGEELAGAKQNRVLNTTILIRKNSEVKIPVSCTEQGRWAYSSREFTESGNIMAPTLRRTNVRDVADSLERTREFRTNQGQVWSEIRRTAQDTNVRSITGAMSDIYEARKATLDMYLKAFRPVPEQKGILAFVDGGVVGMDFISRTQAFGVLFPKLVKSYAMEAMLAKERKPRGPADGGQNVQVGHKPESGPSAPVPSAADARKFLDELAACEEKRYESVGEGWDYRFSSAHVVGSALAVEDKIVHMAFFRVTESDRAGSMATAGRRRTFRLD